MSVNPVDSTIRTIGPPAFGAPLAATGSLAGMALLLRYGLAVAVSLSLFVAVWQLVVVAEFFPAILLPSPNQVLTAGTELSKDGTLLADILASLRRATLGFGIGSGIAIALGAFTGRSRFASGLLEPMLRFLAPVPAIAIVPLAILWFGVGESSKLFLVSFGVFFPVWISTHGGIASTPEDYLRVCACLGASRWQRLSAVVLPQAIPDIVAGLRVGGAVSFIMIVASEMTGTDVGLGFRLEQAAMFSQSDRLILCLLLLGALGALVDQAIYRLTEPFTRWSKVAGQ